MQVRFLGGEDLLEEEMAAHWPGKFHGQRSLVHGNTESHKLLSETGHTHHISVEVALRLRI